MEEQRYDKVRQHASKSGQTIARSLIVLQCAVTILVYSSTGSRSPFHLVRSDYQEIVEKLKRDGEIESLHGIGGVCFIKEGSGFPF